jgi:hypothetical protein
MMKEMKADPILYEEAFKHVKGENYNSVSNYHSKNKKSMQEYNEDAAIMASVNHHAHGKVQQNVRVRLPTKDDPELSDRSSQEEEDLGRSKIKKNAEMRRTG